MKSSQQLTENKFDYLILAGGKFPQTSRVRKLYRFCNQVVAVDRGIYLANEARIPCDLFIGDGDSSRRNGSKFHGGLKSFILPTAKSESDLEWTLKHLLGDKQSKKTALLLGALEDHQGRPDHAYANWLLMDLYPNRLVAIGSGKWWALTLKNADFVLKTKKSTVFSLISSKIFKATVAGAQFQVTNHKILNPTHGLSNIAPRNRSIKIKIRGSALLFVAAPLK